MFLMKTQDSMLMLMHEMQLDHDPDIAPIGIILLIAPFGKIVLIVPFGKMILIAPFGKMIFNRPIWQNDNEYESPYLTHVNRPIWHL